VIDHVILNVTDLEVSKHFYAQTVAPLGYAPSWEDDKFVAMGGDNDFGLYRRGPKGAVHVSFRSPDRETVDAFHEAGLAAAGVTTALPAFGRTTASTTPPRSSSIRTATTSRRSASSRRARRTRTPWLLRPLGAAVTA
jgi:hypothetical protein